MSTFMFIPQVPGIYSLLNRKWMKECFTLGDNVESNLQKELNTNQASKLMLWRIYTKNQYLGYPQHYAVCVSRETMDR